MQLVRLVDAFWLFCCMRCAAVDDGNLTTTSTADDDAVVQAAVDKLNIPNHKLFIEEDVSSTNAAQVPGEFSAYSKWETGNLLPQ